MRHHLHARQWPAHNPGLSHPVMATQGARKFAQLGYPTELASHMQGQVQQVAVDDEGTVTDVDTVQDLARAALRLAARRQESSPP